MNINLSYIWKFPANIFVNTFQTFQQIDPTERLWKIQCVKPTKMDHNRIMFIDSCDHYLAKHVLKYICIYDGFHSQGK